VTHAPATTPADAALVTDILDRVVRNASPRCQDSANWTREPISASEARVLRLLPTNLSAPEIARHLFLSVHTVRAHQKHVYQKLGVHSRTEAVERARVLGLLHHG
jgi:LuxR family maltose regulon positive regulatory protein